MQIDSYFHYTQYMKDLSITKSIVPLEDINLALSAAILYQTHTHTPQMTVNFVLHKGKH